MVVVSVTIPSDLLKSVDDFRRHRGYFSRSEVFRDALRSLISETELLKLKLKTERAVATIMIVSESARKDVTMRLIRLTCDLSDIIKESLHRHIGLEYCLTIFFVEGTVQRIGDLTGKIRGMRGIQQVKTLLLPRAAH